MPVSGRYRVVETLHIGTGSLQQIARSDPLRTVLIIAQGPAGGNLAITTQAGAAIAEIWTLAQFESVEITYHKHGDLVQLDWFASYGFAQPFRTIEVFDVPGFCTQAQIGE